MGRRRRWLILAVAILVQGIAIGAGSKWWQHHQIRHSITEIKAEIAAGRHAIAACRLTELLTWAPGYTGLAITFPSSWTR